MIQKQPVSPDSTRLALPLGAKSSFQPSRDPCVNRFDAKAIRERVASIFPDREEEFRHRLIEAPSKEMRAAYYNVSA